ncbi:hypothetical protein GRB31_20685 (plasmid) [Ralstonia solanacearum]|uniref:hypothetical protein n=1 Tax=Ralstonia solanacearum TaxID=305 RepID=UPI000B06C6B5|nr:hypothetical protein [Ralstonia solanacearum]QHB57377.1 hypothetical protein GRB31_20685 [Ralstonia solanacearum]
MMTTTSDALADWTREIDPACDQRAFLFYVAFGTTGEGLRLSRSKYRCDGIPDGIELMAYGPDNRPEVVDTFREGCLWTELQAQRPELAEIIAAQTACVVVRGAISDATTLNYFRNTIGLLTCLLDHGSVGIYDPQSLHWWSPSGWKTHVFEPASPQPNTHVVTLVSEQGDGLLWFHTRGLRKFGRPDLSLHNVAAESQQTVSGLFGRLIDFQAYGGALQNKQVVRTAAFPEGLICMHTGDENDPDFNNTHIEMTRQSSAANG